MSNEARTTEARRRDTLRRLEHDVDAWVATANGWPYLVPLSFLWNGKTLLFATPRSSPTARNLAATGKVRLGIGLTRDVVLVEGTVRLFEVTEIPDEVGDAFATKAGFDPRRSATPFIYFEVHPRRIQAWREENELEGRDLMRDGEWISD